MCPPSAASRCQIQRASRGGGRAAPCSCLANDVADSLWSSPTSVDVEHILGVEGALSELESPRYSFYTQRAEVFATTAGVTA